MHGKSELALRLRKYILHGLLIHQRSPSSAYRTLKRAMALDRLHPLSKPDIAAQYSADQFSRLVIRHRHDLNAILPVPSNASFQSSHQSLEKLLELAHSILQANNNDTISPSHSALCLNTYKKGSMPLE